jgi:hypothetical protein
MAEQTGEDVMAVLPDGLDNDERRGGVDALEDIHSHALAEDEAVLEVFSVRVGAADLEALGGEGLNDGALGLGLGGPTQEIGRLTQIAVCDEDDFAGDGWDWSNDLGDGIL